VEEGHSLNTAHSNITQRRTKKMEVDVFFNTILIALIALIFIAIVLGFLYIIYGKEDETDEEEE
jgi:hypothetical protein